MFARMPGLQRILVVDKRRYDRHWLTLWAQTVTTLWDLAVDLRGSALTLLLPARRRAIMRGGRRPGHRLTHLAGALGLADRPSPVTWTNAADRARAAHCCRTAARSSRSARRPTGPARFGRPSASSPCSARSHRLCPAPVPRSSPGPGEAERAMAAPVLAGLPGAIDLAGRLTLPEAAACLARCRCSSATIPA